MSKEIKDELVRVNEKIDEVQSVNSEQNVILGKMEVMFEKQQEILDNHMQRTAANEKRIELVEERQKTVDEKLIKHLSFIKGAVWLFGALITLAMILSKFGVF